MDYDERLADVQRTLKEQAAQNRVFQITEETRRGSIDAAALDRVWGRQFFSEELIPFLMEGNTEKRIPLFPDNPEPAAQSAGIIQELQKKLMQLHRKGRLAYRQHGRWELFLGYPFLEGRFQDNTVLYAPVLLLPLKLVKLSTGWHAESLGEGIPLLNPSLVNGFEMFHHREFTESGLTREFLHTIAENRKIYPQQVVSLLQAAGVQLDSDPFQQKSILPLKHRPAGSGQFSLLPHGIISSFSHLPGMLWKEYEMMRKEARVPAIVKELLNPTGELIDNIKPAQELSIDENHCCYVTDLDSSQQRALQACSMGRQFLLAGAPGTGKTQVMVNCIADSLLHGRTVLFISSSAASAESLYDRLEKCGLSSSAVLIRDQFLGRKQVLEKTASLVSAYAETAVQQLEDEDAEAVRVKKEYYECSRSIERYITQLNSMISVLEDRSTFGISLNELYEENCPEHGYVIDELTLRKEKIAEFDAENLPLLERACEEIIPLSQTLAPGHSLSERISFAGLQEYDRDSWITAIDQILSRLEILHDRKNPLADWADADIRNEEFPEHTFRRLLRKLEKIIYELKQGTLLDSQEISDESELRSLIEQAQGAHAWQPRFWKTLRSLKTHAGSDEGVFSYSRKVRFTLSVLDQLREIARECSCRIPYAEQYQIIEQAENLRYWVIQYLELWHEFQGLKSLFEEEKLHGLFRSAVSQQENGLAETLQQLSSSLRDHFYEAVELDEYLAQFSNEMQNVLKAVAEYCGYDSQRFSQSGVRALHDTVLFCKIQVLEDTHREILSSAGQVNEIIQNLKETARRKQQLLSFLVGRKTRQKALQGLQEQQQLQDVFQQGDTRDSLKEFIEMYFSEGLLHVFPCWIMTAEAALSLLPQEQSFDLLLLDEAANRQTETVLPLYCRAKHAVTAGDGLYTQKKEDTVYASCLHALESVPLLKNYRFSEEALFDFTNNRCFGGRVHTAPGKMKGHFPMRTVVSEGTAWMPGTAVDEVKKLLAERHVKDSCELAAFSHGLQKNIEQAVWQAARDDTVFAENLKSALKFQKKQLAIGTVEELKGNIRDMLILFLTEEMLTDEGEHLLHKLLSNTRKEAVLCISQSMLSDAEGENTFAGDIVSYVSSHSQENLPKSSPELPHGFTDAVASTLKEAGFHVDKHVGLSPCRIDLAVAKPGKNTYGLGILLYPRISSFDNEAGAREQFLDRHLFFEAKGWKVHNLLARNWRTDKTGEIQRIIEKLEEE